MSSSYIAPSNWASSKSASVKSTPQSLAPRMSVLKNQQSPITAFDRFAFLKSDCANIASRRSACRNCAPCNFALAKFEKGSAGVEARVVRQGGYGSLRIRASLWNLWRHRSHLEQNVMSDQATIALTGVGVGISAIAVIVSAITSLRIHNKQTDRQSRWAVRCFDDVVAFPGRTSTGFSAGVLRTIQL